MLKLYIATIFLILTLFTTNSFSGWADNLKQGLDGADKTLNTIQNEQSTNQKSTTTTSIQKEASPQPNKTPHITTPTTIDESKNRVENASKNDSHAQAKPSNTSSQQQNTAIDVSNFDIKGIELGMTLDDTIKLLPNLQTHKIDVAGLNSGIEYESELQDDSTQENLKIAFATKEYGNGENRAVKISYGKNCSFPYLTSTEREEVLEKINKKYGRCSVSNISGTFFHKMWWGNCNDKAKNGAEEEVCSGKFLFFRMDQSGSFSLKLLDASLKERLLKKSIDKNNRTSF